MTEDEASREPSSHNEGSGQVDETIEHLREIHQRHLDEASALQRYADRATRILGRPLALAIIAVIIVAWLVANYELSRWGYAAIDPPPFVELEIAATLAGLGIALLILTTQRHEDELAQKRSELTLQIAVLSEKKLAKVIELLEEQRRDNPLLSNRTDAVAAEMEQATDPKRSLELIKDAAPNPV